MPLLLVSLLTLAASSALCATGEGRKDTNQTEKPAIVANLTPDAHANPGIKTGGNAPENCTSAEAPKDNGALADKDTFAPEKNNSKRADDATLDKNLPSADSGSVGDSQDAVATFAKDSVDQRPDPDKLRLKVDTELTRQNHETPSCKVGEQVSAQ